MSIRPVRELPKRIRGKHPESYVAKDVREFIRNGHSFACVESPGRRGANIATALKNYIIRHPDQCRGIGCCQRDGHAYLYRKEDAV